MAASETDEAPEGGEDPRLSSLDDRLKAAHRAEKKRTSTKRTGETFTGKGAGQGQQILSALIGAPFGAALIGWVIDRLAGTSPVWLLVMLVLGFGAAISQVIRISKDTTER